MEKLALIRAAEITVRRAICERYPPGREREAWLGWLESIQAEHASGTAWGPRAPAAPCARAPTSHARERTRN